MGRPERHDVDYFPFFVKSGKTLDFLELKYGPEGTGYFTNILRFLSTTPNHYYCIREETEKMVFLSRIKTTDEKKTMDIIEIMVKTGKLDKDLWEKHKVIASEAFLKSLEPAYEKRNNKVITIGEIRAIFERGVKNPVFGDGNSVKVDGNPAGDDSAVVYGVDKPQSKVKKSKVKKSKEESSGSDEPPNGNHKKPPLRERDPVNDMERVEKAYLQNWDTLYSHGRVQTTEPVVTWGQTRKLLKNHFKKLKPEQIIQALNAGMNDNDVMKGGYSLSTMLTAWVLNRLINAVPAGSSQREKLTLE